MNAISMIRAATVLLTIGALGGMLMALIRFLRSQNPPSWLAMLHGFLAAAGITLLLYAAFTVGIPQLTKIGLVLLLIAALGGAVLNLRYQWQRELLPPSWLIGHAVLAAIGFTLVLLSAWRTM
jgi:hypothetical protein